jgi:rhodanese-related sulfurtransferase
MKFVALALAALAVWIAFSARRAVSSGGAAVPLDELRSDHRRQLENLASELRAELTTTRQLLAELAAGARLDREQILEGRLWRDVDTAEGKALVASGTINLLDVRTPQETAGGIIPGAQLIPVDQLEERLRELPKNGRPTLVYCAGGGRSAAACEFLSSQGIAGLHNLAGGINSWNGPVERPER